MKSALAGLFAALISAPGFSPSAGERELLITPLEVSDRILVRRGEGMRRQPAWLGYDHGRVEQDYLLKPLYQDLTPLNIRDPALLVMPAGYDQAPSLWRYPSLWSCPLET